jgi:hypothetical protein
MIGTLRKKWGARHRELWLFAAVCGWLLCGSAVPAQDLAASEGPGAPQNGTGHPRRFDDHDVSSRRVGSPVAFPISPHLQLALSGDEQSFAGSAGRHLSCADAVHRVARYRHNRISLRRSGIRGPRSGRSFGVAGFFKLDVVRIHELGRRQ